MITGYVDIEKIIYEACQRLGISNSEGYEMRFTNLIIDAEIKIGTGSVIGEVLELYQPGSVNFKNGERLLLPNYLVSDLEIYDSKGCFMSKANYKSIGHHIVFSEKQENPIIIKFQGLLLDIENNPYISQHHFEALVTYLVYMESTTRYYKKDIARYMYIDARQDWRDSLGEARGNDFFVTEEQMAEVGLELHSILRFKNYDKTYNTIDMNSLLDIYETALSIRIGVLPLATTLDVATDYVESDTLTDEVVESVSKLSSDEYTLETTYTGRITVVVPYASGTITSLKDSLNNEIFPNYFDIINDSSREIRIYKAKNFLTASNYKLKFTFTI